MPARTNGPVFRAFQQSQHAGGLRLSRSEIETCRSIVDLLDEHETSSNKPGMLLGKVQSGKTRTYIGALAVALDSGYDVVVVLTKTSKPLATQTVRRLQGDLSSAVS